MIYLNVLTHLIKDLRFTTSRVTGMNLWFAPQISEHCPKKRPEVLGRKLI
jgi:hypothetical protein